MLKIDGEHIYSIIVSKTGKPKLRRTTRSTFDGQKFHFSEPEDIKVYTSSVFGSYDYYSDVFAHVEQMAQDSPNEVQVWNDTELFEQPRLGVNYPRPNKG